jgi:hypothetical protein
VVSIITTGRQSWCYRVYHALCGEHCNHNRIDEPDPISSDRVEIAATSPADLYTAPPVASLTDSPTSSPISISPAPPTATKNLWTATPVASLTGSPTNSPVSIPTAPPATTKANADTNVLILGVICVDDTVATFAVNRVTRNCAWLSESLALQVLLCRPGKGAFEFCRETCDNCST